MAEESNESVTVGTVKAAWALRLLWLVLLVSTGLAGWLAWSHLHLTHGVGAFESGCSIDATFDCDKVNTSDWSELFGIPISLYALPVYAAMAWMAGIGLRDDRRGSRARGLLTTLAGLNLAVSLYLLLVMTVQIGAFCAFCITLDALHLLGFILVVLPPGGRRPAIPEGLDLFGAAFVGVFIMATTFKFTAVYGARLDRVALAEVMGDQALMPAGVDVQTESRSGSVTALPSKRYDVPIDKYDPSWGPRKADVVVVEFADFECGYCRRLSHTMARLRDKYQDRVRFVFKHYPMDQECNKRLKRQHHPSACEAARASICALDQGHFESYHDLLFQNQKHLEKDDLLGYARRLNLEMERFEGCMEGPGSLEQLREDISHGGYIDISGTPRTFVNGLMFKGAASEALLDAAIRAELGEAEVREDGRVVSKREVVTDKPLPPGETPMVKMEVDETTFWIDAVEASVDAEGRARSVARVGPHTRSWNEAKTACEAAGKRLCSVEEWMTACQGAVPVDDDQSGSVLDDPIEGRPYPYGAHYAQGFCHDSGDKDRQTSVPAGSRAACRSPEGAYDLTGNLQEWVGESAEQAVVMGGAWYYDDQATCGRSGDTYGPDWSSRTTGFRCCADADVAMLGGSLELVDDAAGLEKGGSMPAFELKTLEGGSITQEALEGKVTLVAFWASWCGPCRRELPALSKVHEQLKGKGFQVLAVNVDKEEALARRFLGDVTPPYPVLLDPTASLMGSFDVVAMPTSVLIGPDLTVVSRHEGYSEERLAEVRKEVEELLAGVSHEPG